MLASVIKIMSTAFSHIIYCKHHTLFHSVDYYFFNDLRIKLYTDFLKYFSLFIFLWYWGLSMLSLVTPPHLFIVIFYQYLNLFYYIHLQGAAHVEIREFSGLGSLFPPCGPRVRTQVLGLATNTFTYRDIFFILRHSHSTVGWP